MFGNRDRPKRVNLLFLHDVRSRWIRIRNRAALSILFPIRIRFFGCRIGCWIFFRLLILAFFYFAACGVGLGVVREANLAADYEHSLSIMHAPEEAARTKLKSLLDSLTFSLYSGGEQARAAEQAARRQAQMHNRRSRLLSGVFALISTAVIALALAFSFSRSSAPVESHSGADETRGSEPNRPRPVWVHLTILSGICLAIALVTPLLTIAAGSRLPLIGNVVLSHETKSIADMLGTLWGSRDLVLFALIGGFSLLLPVAKTTVMLLAHLTQQRRSTALRLASAVGKWSMADVFVVGVLVAFLGMSGQQHSSAEVGLGFYYFVAYCLLSLSVSAWSPVVSHARLSGGQ